MAAVSNGQGGDDKKPPDEEKWNRRKIGNYIGGNVSSDSCDEEDTDELAAFDEWSKKPHGRHKAHKVIRKPKSELDVRYNAMALESKGFHKEFAKMPMLMDSENESGFDENGAPVDPFERAWAQYQQDMADEAESHRDKAQDWR